MLRRRLAFAVTLTIIGATLSASAVRSAENSVTLSVVNIPSGTEFRHPVVLLRGVAKGLDRRELAVENQSSDRPSSSLTTRIEREAFKALVELVPGENRIRLSAAGRDAYVMLRYRPQTNPYRVRLIYYTDASGRTGYQTQRPDDPHDFADKLDTAAKLMQTLTAESLHALGYGYRTFNLELDAEGRAKVHVVRGKHPMAYYHERDGNQLYREIHQHINQELPDRRVKNVVVMSFTRFDAETRQVKAHTALGGGNLGLFSSVGVFTWPSTLAEVQSAFMDTTRIDGTRIHDDSVSRSTYWAQASTTLGATIHELGHAFGLPHSTDRFDIMTRGFDHFNRVFTLTEPPHARRRAAVPVREEEIARFAAISAHRLAFSPYFRLDEQPDERGPRPTARFNSQTGNVTITAPLGLRVIGVNGVRGQDTEALDNLVYRAEAPKEITLSLADLHSRAQHRPLSLSLIDAQGQQVRVDGSRWGAD